MKLISQMLGLNNILEIWGSVLRLRGLWACVTRQVGAGRMLRALEGGDSRVGKQGLLGVGRGGVNLGRFHTGPTPMAGKQTSQSKRWPRALGVKTRLWES